MKNEFQNNDANDKKIIIPIPDETIRKIKLHSRRTLLGVTIAGLVISGGQTVQANSIKVSQNTAPKSVYSNSATHNLFANRLMGLDIIGENVGGIFRAPQTSTDPNYAADEAKIKNFSASERYRSTQMEQGNGPAFSISEPEMDYIDGFRYQTLEPSATSDDKTLWGG